MAINRRAVIAGGAGLVAVGAGGLAARRVVLDQEPALPPATNGGRPIWSNWAGTAFGYPAERLAPANEAELAAAMTSARTPIRPVGSGHSFSALVPTDGAMISLDQLNGLVAHDKERHTATVRGGTRLGMLGPMLAEIGQQMVNLPDINKQSLAGAIATGTHGTGTGIPAIHGNVIGLRLAKPDGQIVDCDRENNPDLFHASRVGLGAFGIVTQVTLQNSPLTKVKKVTKIAPTEAVIADWPTLRRQHRNAEFLVLPFTDRSFVITHDDTTETVKPRGPDRETDGLLTLKAARDWLEFAPALRRRLVANELDKTPVEISVDDGWKLLSNERPVRFKEMEYHLPIENQADALKEIIGLLESKQPNAFMPIEARCVAPDDAWLSPFYERECGSIAVHAYYKDDHQFLFGIVEPVLRRHGGRPHWGKLHSLGTDDFAKLYPRWAEVQRVRRAVDPQGRMLTPFLKRIFENG